MFKQDDRFDVRARSTDGELFLKLVERISFDVDIIGWKMPYSDGYRIFTNLRERASKVEELLWGLIPEAQHLRANKRSIEELGKINIISHPLMLTQMLIAYHMVKAALGHHAI